MKTYQIITIDRVNNRKVVFESQNIESCKRLLSCFKTAGIKRAYIN